MSENKDEMINEEVENVTTETIETASEDVVPYAEYEKLAKQTEQYLNLAKQIQADFENYKRNMQKIVKDKELDGVMKAANAIFPAIDSFKKARKIITDKSCISGIKMIEKQLLDALAGLKIIRVKSVGEKFDPNMHNAVMLVEDPNVESGTIVEELEAGYMYEDKVMRFSSVIVAK